MHVSYIFSFIPPLSYGRNRQWELNPLQHRGNYSATSNVQVVHCPLTGGLLFWYSEEGTGRSRSPPRTLLAIPNVTTHRHRTVYRYCIPITV